MFVSRSDVSFRCLDPARESRHRRERDLVVALREWAGIRVVLRTNRSRAGAAGAPTNAGFHSVAGARVSLERDLSRTGAALE